ncbi:hypothetical protein [Thalassolituus oleivorans]|uniref:PhnE/PtxC family ABC transporter permease n=1 Tax=Thalassolituus oleivorans TaxID=187493 RepID=UPI0030C82543
MALSNLASASSFISMQLQGTGRRLFWLSIAFIVSALVCLPFADLQLHAVDPWLELSHIAWGMITPSFAHLTINELLQALGHTVAFALLAVVISVPLGVVFAMLFRFRVVRWAMASIRAVHEIFWGLLFMQIFGLSATTGLLAILIPYTGVFAKVFAEIFDQQSQLPTQSMSPKAGALSRYVYGLIPQSYGAMAGYVRYRFECALRSSAILGFIGLPTLGFFLESSFKQGDYSEAAGVFWLFLLLIATVRYWLKPRFWWLYALAAIWLLPESPTVYGSTVWQFFSQDIWPSAFLRGDLTASLSWLDKQFWQVAWPAIGTTLVITQLALVLTGILTVLMYPLATKVIVVNAIRLPSRFVILFLRSMPELMLAFIFLLLFGPSAIPAIIALAFHNAGLIVFLLSNASEADAKEHATQAFAKRALDRYVYQELPRRYTAFLAFLFYRWEVILRESAIMGILGIATLGFYVDSAFEDIRFDRAFFLILITALLNIVVDSVSRSVRQRAGLTTANLAVR